MGPGRMKPVITVTMNPTVDVTTTTTRVEEGRKLRCGEPRFDPGGGGINVARMVRELGGEAVAFFPCGGSTGEMLKDLCGREKLQVEAMPIEGRTRESLKVFEESSEGTFRFLLPGPRLTDRERDAALDRIEDLASGSRFVVLSGSLPPGLAPDFYREAAERASAAGARVALDTSGEALTAAIGPSVCVLKPNHDEAAELAGGEIVEDEARRERLLQRLLGEGIEIVFLTLGKKGVFAARRDGTRLRMRPPEVSRGSPVGAGDSFLGAAIHALSNDAPFEEAARLAVAAAAAAVESEGTSLARRDDILALCDGVERIAHERAGQ